MPENRALAQESVLQSIRDAPVHRSDAPVHRFPKRERYGRTPDSVLLDKELSLEAKAIYGILARHAFKTGKVYIGHRRVAGLVGVHQTTVSRRIQELLQQKHITLTEELRSGRRAGYQLTSNLFEEREKRPKDGKRRPGVRSAARMWAEDNANREVS